MPQVSKAVIDANIRAAIFEALNLANLEGYQKVNDRQFGTLVIDGNNTERYVRIGVIVAEEREDMTARKLMESEIADYNAKQAKKIEKAAERAKKAAEDKAKREAAKKEGD